MFRVPQVFHMARDDADEPESDGSYAKVEAVSVPSLVPGLIVRGGCSWSPKPKILCGIRPWFVVAQLRPVRPWSATPAHLGNACQREALRRFRIRHTEHLDGPW